MDSKLKKAHDYFTYKDYKSWPSGERWELIDGEAYDMSPAPNIFHQSIAIHLSSNIYHFLEGKKCKVFSSPIDVLLQDKKDPRILSILLSSRIFL